jgi:probable HAF family extracellular repeat protein
MSNLGTLPGGTSSVAAGINNQGAIAGSSGTAAFKLHAVIWQKDGDITDLGTFGGDTSTATAINNRGQVVGASNPNGRLEAFLWTP